jgi:DNA polymerase III epsilon subunit-like protein
MSKGKEIFISVDVETAGPIPGEYSLLSIGACNVDNPSDQFACELKPVSMAFVPDALAVTGLSLKSLEDTGLEPKLAMFQFATWARSLAPNGEALVFVGFNAAFDWSFVNYYFHHFLGENPFGFSALDIKSFYMGASGGTWSDTRSSQMVKALKPRHTGDHNALHDAIFQAELFRLCRKLR